MPEDSVTEAELLALMGRKPFVPFTIALHTGRRFAVVERQRLACCDGRVVMFPPNSCSEFFRVSQIAALEVPELFA
jgi:hypothetical protein